jgi:hypothetical protein
MFEAMGQNRDCFEAMAHNRDSRSYEQAQGTMGTYPGTMGT